MENFLTGVSLILCSVLMLVMTRYFKRRTCYFMGRHSDNTLFIHFFYDLFAMKFVFYYLIVAILHVYFNWENDVTRFNVKPEEILIVYVVEAFSCFIYFLVMQILLKNNKQNLSLPLVTRKGTATIANFVLIFYSLLVCAQFLFIFSPDFLENLQNSFFFIIPLIMFIGSPTAIFISIVGGKFFKKQTVVIAYVSLLLYVISVFASFSRGFIIWPVFWALFVVYYFRRELFKKCVVVCVAGAIGFAYVQDSFESVADAQREVETLSGKFDLLSDSGKSKKSDGKIEKILRDFDGRFGNVTTFSVGYYRLYDEGTVAGLNPILNSFYVFLPRMFFENKPEATSYNGDYYGKGMYMCSGKITGVYTSMCEFASSAHAYWELGILGVIIFSIIPAFYVFFCIKLFRKLDLLSMPFIVAIIFPWGYNEPKLWVSEIVLQFGQVILPIVLFIIVYNFIKGKPIKQKYSRKNNKVVVI